MKAIVVQVIGFLLLYGIVAGAVHLSMAPEERVKQRQFVPFPEKEESEAALPCDCGAACICCGGTGCGECAAKAKAKAKAAAKRQLEFDAVWSEVVEIKPDKVEINKSGCDGDDDQEQAVPPPDRVRTGTAKELGYPKGFPVDEHWIAWQEPDVSILITRDGTDKAGEQVWLVRIWNRKGVYDSLIPARGRLTTLYVNPSYAGLEMPILLGKGS